MSLANLEKTLLVCIEYYQKKGNDDKVAKLKEHLISARSTSLSSDNDDFLFLIKDEE